MSNRGNTDPEVERDAALQRASERDRSRGGPSPFHDRSIVAEWHCRNRACPNGQPPVAVSSSTLDAFRTFNAELRRRGEPELAESEIVLCVDCRRTLEEFHARQAVDRAARVSALMRELRKNRNPKREIEILDALPALGMTEPEINSIRTSLAERRQNRPDWNA